MRSYYLQTEASHDITMSPVGVDRGARSVPYLADYYGYLDYDYNQAGYEGKGALSYENILNIHFFTFA